ncbi:tyrosine-type recombinase/integrase [Natronobacterium texcoconense]|uniref:Site-specific recombinase XerD n=1 Tax=Natronobacterium texcoconense TaxID=1095778 RepID=A0A1H1AJZ2_NATTX|nr:tyrosine-type recombinase/integrase [Natronobacterium texcoconense]SDQ40113.1 Site-specific recombinase XerD [Natronobacterium texcoconense]
MSTTKHVDVQRSLQNLENEVHSENAKAVRRFINHQAAEGISDVQQERQIQSFKTLLKRFTPDGFRLQGASEDELKQVLADLNRSDYAEATKHKFKGTIKKFYKVENGGHEHPDKVDFFTVTKKKATPITRDDLFTEDERQRLFRNFSNTRDRAFTSVLYESAARPGELLECSISDFTSNGKGDFIFLEGSKGTPDRNNQLVRSGRTLREWIAQHPLGGEVGNIDDPSAPLWVKREQQKCRGCGKIPRFHDDQCEYTPDLRDRMNYNGFLNRFKDACERADIPESKRRPYNLRHTRLTEVATFMGYEQLNKFAGWVPGSSRAKVYVHLNNDDVNQAIRKEYGLDTTEDPDENWECTFCGAANEGQHTECRQCGRPNSLEAQSNAETKERVIERLAELEEAGVLDKLEEFDEM